jgi:tripartite-type tricarboxylate transporter receptor subunit TctC
MNALAPTHARLRQMLKAMGFSGLIGLAAAGFASTLPQAAQAQADFPNKPIRLIVPLGPGGLGDVIARRMGEEAGRRLGQPFVIDNRPGAGGTLGSAVAAAAPADGYTIVLGSIGTIGIAPSLYRSLSYDADKAFAPITLAVGGQFFFAVAPNVPAGTLAEFITYAKANAGKLNYGSQGSGSTLHLAMEVIMRKAGVQMVHVPFKSAPDLATNLISGEIQAAVTDFSSVLPLVQAGRVKALAVTGGKRSDAVPQIPTLGQAGLSGTEFISWVGFLAPAGTPRPILEKLNTAMVQALQTPTVVESIRKAGGSDIFASSMDEFATFLARERAQWSAVIRELGITAN